MKLNLGCGIHTLDSYINIDGEDYPGVDSHMDLRKLPYKEESVDEVYSKDVLEHFGWREWRDVLTEWVRVIRPGGVIKLRFPDIDMLIANYQNEIMRIGKREEEVRKTLLRNNFNRFIQLLFGNQDFINNAHLTGLTAEVVTEFLEGLGMTVLPHWYDGGRDCRVTATKGEPIDVNLLHPE